MAAARSTDSSLMVDSRQDSDTYKTAISYTNGGLELDDRPRQDYTHRIADTPYPVHELPSTKEPPFTDVPTRTGYCGLSRKLCLSLGLALVVVIVVAAVVGGVLGSRTASSGDSSSGGSSSSGGGGGGGKENTTAASDSSSPAMKNPGGPTDALLMAPLGAEHNDNDFWLYYQTNNGSIRTVTTPAPANLGRGPTNPRFNVDSDSSIDTGITNARTRTPLAVVENAATSSGAVFYLNASNSVQVQLSPGTKPQDLLDENKNAIPSFNEHSRFIVREIGYEEDKGEIFIMLYKDAQNFIGLMEGRVANGNRTYNWGTVENGVALQGQDDTEIGLGLWGESGSSNLFYAAYATTTSGSGGVEEYVYDSGAGAWRAGTFPEPDHNFSGAMAATSFDPVKNTTTRIVAGWNAEKKMVIYSVTSLGELWNTTTIHDLKNTTYDEVVAPNASYPLYLSHLRDVSDTHTDGDALFTHQTSSGFEIGAI